MLLYLTDTSFPCGSFCFSNGVETVKAFGNGQDIEKYITDLLIQTSSDLPFVLAAKHHKSSAVTLEILCEAYSVLNRCDYRLKASQQQGLSFYTAISKCFFTETSHDIHKIKELLGKQLASYNPIVFGICSSYLNLSNLQTCQFYLISFLKNTVAAAVRLDILDPYRAVAYMTNLTPFIAQLIEPMLDLSFNDIRDADIFIDNYPVHQVNPALDIYQGLHDVIGTKLFIS